MGLLKEAQCGFSLMCQVMAKVSEGSVAAETLLEGGLLVHISGEPAIPEEGPEPEKGNLLLSRSYLGLPWWGRGLT